MTGSWIYSDYISFRMETCLMAERENASMENKSQYNDFLIMKLCGMALLLLGGSVVYGWLAGHARLVQVLPHFVPMQFNTALGFVLTGLMLLSAGFRKYLLAGFFALIVLGGAGATVIEYILDTDFGIDEFFVEPDIMTKTTHAGRMAPATGLCFVLAAMTVLLPARFKASGLCRSHCRYRLSGLFLLSGRLQGYIRFRRFDPYGRSHGGWFSYNSYRPCLLYSPYICEIWPQTLDEFAGDSGRGGDGSYAFDRL